MNEYFICICEIDTELWAAEGELASLFCREADKELIIDMIRSYAEANNICLYIEVYEAVIDQTSKMCGKHVERICWVTGSRDTARKKAEKKKYGEFYLNSKVLPDIPKTRKMKKREYVNMMTGENVG